MAYDIKRIETEFEEKLKWKFIGMFDLEANVFKDINIPETVHEIWFIVGYKNNDQIYGGLSAIIPNNLRAKNITSFGDIYSADNTKIANGFYGFYENNIFRVTIREILINHTISIRVYYR